MGEQQAIIDCLFEAGSHMTASAVHAALAEGGRKVSSATVYRQLEKLVLEGVVVNLKNPNSTPLTCSGKETQRCVRAALQRRELPEPPDQLAKR